MTLTIRNVLAGIGIILIGIMFLSLGSALTSQTPDPETNAEGWLDGLAEWSRNVGIEFAKGLGTGLGYLGWPVMIAGILLLAYWHFN